MTLLQIWVCDHCERQIVGPSVPYRVGLDGPLLDICGDCQKKPFKQVPPSSRAATIANIVKMALSDSTTFFFHAASKEIA